MNANQSAQPTPAGQNHPQQNRKPEPGKQAKTEAGEPVAKQSPDLQMGAPGQPPDQETIALAQATKRYAQPENLTKYAWLSVFTALATILLKGSAWLLTGSVGLLSDAAESLVNLGAAIVAVIALRVALRPPDSDHHFGHSKSEYFSAAFEGSMIFVAAIVIIYSSIERLFNPKPLENLGIGLLISVLSAVLNGVVGAILIRIGRKHRSSALVADGKHLFTDVVTTIGVVVGVLLVGITGLDWLDPVVALLAGANILWTGWNLLKESINGLMDVSLPEADNDRLRAILDEFTSENVTYHAFRSRESGSMRFLEFHLLMPGAWTVQQSHDFVEEISERIAEEYPDVRLTIHVEPIEDPASYEDINL